MKSLRDIILGNHQVTLQILFKCEKVLQQIAPGTFFLILTPLPDFDTLSEHC